MDQFSAVMIAEGAQEAESEEQVIYALEQIPGYEHMLSQYRRAGLSAITAARRLRESLEEAVERCDLDRTTIYEGSQDTFNDIVTSVLARLVPGDGART